MGSYYVEKTNYKQWLNDCEELLKSIFNFFDTHSTDEFNYYDSQEVIDFQDKLNQYSIAYFETPEQKIRNILEACKTTIKSFICQTNDKDFRKYVKDQVECVIENCKDKDILAEYNVICDERTNPPSLIDKHICRVQVVLQQKGTVNKWWIEECTSSYFKT